MDIAIIAKAKQGYIYKYMVDNNMTASALAKEIGVKPQTMGRIINFKWMRPMRRRSGDITEKLEKYFKIPIEVLFPNELTADIAEKLGRKYVKYQEIDTIQLESISTKYLPFTEQEECFDEINIYEKLDKALNTLTNRQADIIKRRYGIERDSAQTLDEIANDYQVCRERIRQIESKALKKLKEMKT